MARGKQAKYSVVLGAVDKISAPIRKINRQIESMTSPIRKVARSFKSLARESGFGKLGGAIRGVGGGLKRLGFAGIAAVGALGGVVAAVKKIAAGGDEIAKLSAKTGIAAGSLQELQFVAGQAGVESDVFNSSMGALSKRMGELKAGSGALNSLLGKVAPSFRDTLSAAGSTEEAFDLLVGFMRELDDPMKKSAVAAAAFSRAGLGLVNISHKSAEEIDALKKSAHDYGIVLSDEVLAQSEATTDRFQEMGLSVRGLVTTVGANLFPIIDEMATKLRDWIGANREIIASNVKRWVEELIPKIRAVAAVLGEWIPRIVELVQKFGGMKLILGVIAVTVLAPLIVAIAAVGAALASTAGVIALAVAGIAAGFAYLWIQFTENKDAIFAFFDGLKERILGVVSLVQNSAIGKILGAVGGALGIGGGQGPAPPPALASGPAAEGLLAKRGNALLGVPGPDPEKSALAVTVKIDQDGKARDVEVDSGPGGIDLLDAGVVGGIF